MILKFSILPEANVVGMGVVLGVVVVVGGGVVGQASV